MADQFSTRICLETGWPQGLKEQPPLTGRDWGRLLSLLDLQHGVAADLVAEPERPPAANGNPRKFEQIRGRVAELVTYFELAGKRPERISLAPDDYAAVLRSVTARMHTEARAAARAANEQRIAEKRRGPRIKAELVEVTRLSWRGIPVVEGPTYSKHRPVDFTAIPTSSSLLP